jgi:BRCT domain type II-containing protein
MEDANEIDLFNRCITENAVSEVDREAYAGNHMVFTGKFPLTQDKCRDVLKNRTQGPRLIKGYSMEDIDINKFFNGET